MTDVPPLRATALPPPRAQTPRALARRALARRALPWLAALALPAAARADARLPRLGMLAPGRFSLESVRRWTLPELARRGFVEGRTLEVLLRGTDGDLAPLPVLAAELAARCDVVIAVGNPVAHLLRAANPRLPIVLGFAGTDPVADGLAESLARPGGTVTGVVMFAEELTIKRLELARALDPGGAPLGYLASHLLTPQLDAKLRADADALGTALVVARADTPDTYAPAFAALRAAGARVVVVGAYPGFAGNARLLAEQAARAGMPLFCEWRHMAEAGCAMSYGASIAEMRRRNGVQVARILRGEPPGLIPMERAERFELVVNAAALGRLGMAIPPLLLARADEVLE